MQIWLWLIVFDSGLADYQWRQSYWHHNVKPVLTDRRSIQEVNPSVRGVEFHKCECPPNNECQMNFKLNEPALHLMKYAGKINEEDAQTLMKENSQKPLQFLRRIRRFNDEVPDDNCCCPPREVMMPTIITEKQFNETLKRMREEN